MIQISDMSGYYLFQRYGGYALKQKRILSRKKYTKAMKSSRMYRIFAIIETCDHQVTTSSNFQVLNFAIRLPLLCEATVKKSSVCY